MLRIQEVCVALLLLGVGCSQSASVGSGDGEAHALPAQLGAVSDPIWFSPNVGARDTLRLFNEPDSWAQSRSVINVYKFYVQELAAEDSSQCTSCGDVIRPNLIAADAFKKLSDWNIAVAIEAGAVKHHTCDGTVAANGLSGVIDVVEQNGGTVKYISMDEPYAGGEQVVNGQSCHYSMNDSANQVRAFMDTLRTLHPDTQVGDIEPYPYYRLNQLEAWVDALLQAGARPAFFHLDVDRNAVKNVHANVSSDLQALKAFLAARGIPFGIIYWGMEIDVPNNAPNKNQLYAQSVMNWVNTVHQAIGASDQAIFQSWFHSNDGSTIVPDNLPESGPSHLRVLLDGYGVLSPSMPKPDPQPDPNPTPTPNPSPTPSGGDAADIKVEHAYLGILGRTADPGGEQGYANALRNGSLTTVGLCRALAQSGEWAQNKSQASSDDLVNQLYLGILERSPDPGGYASTLSNIQQGHYADVAAAMIDSGEFSQRFLSGP